MINYQMFEMYNIESGDYEVYTSDYISVDL